jgi:hypothetical protein
MESRGAFAQEAIAGGTIREKLRPESFESHWPTVPSQKRVGTSFCVVYAKVNQSHAAGKAGFLTRALHHFVAVGDEGAGRIDGHKSKKIKRIVEI